MTTSIIVVNGQRLVITRPSTSVVVVQKGFINKAAQGAQKITSTVYAAAIILSALRIVSLVNGILVYASTSDATTLDSVLGITLGASVVGAKPEVQSFGEATDLTWTWIPNNRLFLATNGFLTQVEPTVGFVIPMGFAVTATRIYLDIEPVILIE